MRKQNNLQAPAKKLTPCQLNKALVTECQSYITHLLSTVENMMSAVKNRYEMPTFADNGNDLSEAAALVYIEAQATKLLAGAPPSMFYNVDEDYFGALELEPKDYLAHLQAERDARYARIDAEATRHYAIVANETPDEREERIEEYYEMRLAEAQVFAKESAYLSAKARLRIVKANEDDPEYRAYMRRYLNAPNVAA